MGVVGMLTHKSKCRISWQHSVAYILRRFALWSWYLVPMIIYPWYIYLVWVHTITSWRKWVRPKCRHTSGLHLEKKLVLWSCAFAFCSPDPICRGGQLCKLCAELAFMMKLWRIARPNAANANASDFNSGECDVTKQVSLPWYKSRNKYFCTVCNIALEHKQQSKTFSHHKPHLRSRWNYS